MKKLIAVLALTIAFVSCNKTTTETKDFKTAYIDTSKLMEESSEAKDIEEKYKSKANEMEAKLKGDVARFESEQKNFQANMQKNGEAWAKQKLCRTSSEQIKNYNTPNKECYSNCKRKAVRKWTVL